MTSETLSKIAITIYNPSIADEPLNINVGIDEEEPDSDQLDPDSPDYSERLAGEDEDIYYYMDSDSYAHLSALRDHLNADDDYNDPDPECYAIGQIIELDEDFILLGVEDTDNSEDIKRAIESADSLGFFKTQNDI